MQDAISTSTRTQEQRWLMSGALLARFIFIIAGTVLIAILHWPYPTWLKGVAIAVLVTQGGIAARWLQASSTQEQIRSLSRVLLVVDLVVTAVLVYLFAPLYHDVWAFFLLLVVFGATQDRQGAAIPTAVVSAIVVIASYLWPAYRPSVILSPIDVLIDVSIIGLMAAGVDVMYRSIVSRSASLLAHSDAMREIADTQTSRRAEFEAQADGMRKVVELATTLMRERELAPLLDRILEATVQTFGFHCGSILTAERDRQVFVYRSALGYAPEQMRRLMVREVPFAQAYIKLDERFLVRPSAYYAPVERQSWHTDPLSCYRPEAMLVPRERKGAWHEADTLLFTLTSASGEIIGLLCPDAPIDGKVPSVETLGNIAMFARIAASAIENVHLGSIEPQREVMQRVAKILDLTAAIFVERDLDKLLHRILAVMLESFGFNAGTILLRRSGSDSYVRRAAVGFPREVEGREVSGADLREMMNERTRLRETFYYAPMELNVAGGVTRDPSRAVLPRVDSGQWHENDILLFPIFNSNDELIGVLTPDDPKDRRVPAYEIIQAIEVFARIAGLAIETNLIRNVAGKL
jgi:uncharacterized protein YigA (DUF484 family)